MSDSGQSQPGSGRRRWPRDKDPPPAPPTAAATTPPTAVAPPTAAATSAAVAPPPPPAPPRDAAAAAAPWDRERREAGEEPGGGVMQKTPIILAKPPGERAKVGAGPGAGPPPPAAGPAPPIVLMKAREEGRGGAGGEGPALAPPRAEPRPTQPVYQLHNRGLPAPPGTLDPVAGQARLAAPEKMKTSIKLVDEQMNWCDSAIEFLLDQTDVLVVGVLGLQGTGKSTLMSLLAANQPEEDQRAFVFRPQSPEMKERGGNQTCGIDFFITQERVVFLDTQPILSPSILDHLINNDRKLPPEYSLPHTYVEMQSLQIAAFLFTVCHVVLVVQDWFTDLSLYRFLQTAEMVKPSTPSPSHEPSGAAGPDEAAEYYPHLVFLQNKARAEAFCPRRLRQMHLVLDRLMAHSHLKYKGALSMLDCGLFPGLPADFLEAEVNLFLLPLLEAEGEDAPPRAAPGGGPLFPLLPPYRGHGAFGTLLARLRGRVLAAARAQLSHTLLTERNWFHYAARIWDGVKKSSALAEYSRLLA